MTLRSDIFDRCTSGHAGLSALISTRLYQSRVPENYKTLGMPFIVFRTVSANDGYARDRTSAPGRAKYRIQFDCYAATATAANALADQLVDAWSGYNGTDCTLGKCFIQNRTDAYNVNLNEHRVIVDVQIERATDT